MIIKKNIAIIVTSKLITNKKERIKIKTKISLNKLIIEPIPAPELTSVLDRIEFMRSFVLCLL